MTREGTPVRVTAHGTTVAVELPETPGSGYRWHLDDDGSGTVVEDAGWSAGDGPALAGGAGTRRFVLRLPAADGPLELGFSLRRPWEVDGVVERRRVTVERA